MGWGKKPQEGGLLTRLIISRLSTPVALQEAKPPSYDIEYVDTRASPLAVFYFKYRSEGKYVLSWTLFSGRVLTICRGTPAAADHQAPKESLCGV